MSAARSRVGYAHQTRTGVGGAGSVFGTAYPVTVPPIEAFDEWWHARPEGMRRRDPFTPSRYRRMAVMLANGDTKADIARAQGVHSGTVGTALKRLPRALGGAGEE